MLLTLKETYKLVSNSNASRELQLFLREGIRLIEFAHIFINMVMGLL